ncbi:hypothetical protein [Polyangium aurulentum]|uniref:hypothetical protein n=1 Tax=Polyangium aurulentum TaxID=2567896 RepID=UPI0010ADB662|nr:hypothetical protein [Polyangium aurulentum]UQA57832.1 UPF0175 family protein [Polyangium aurulentum]
MQITVDLPDDLFGAPRPAEQIAREIRQAAAMFWLVRGEISPERARELAEGEGTTEPPAPPGIAPQMPDIGEDEAFEMQRLGGTGFDR